MINFSTLRFCFLLVCTLISIGAHSQCNFTNETFTNTPCDNFNEYYIVVDFDHQNNPNQSFKISSTYTTAQSFQYGNLPVTIGPFPGICDLDMDLIMEDLTSGCTEVYVLDLQCCEFNCGFDPYDINLSCSNDGNSIQMDVEFEDISCGSQGYFITFYASGDQGVFYTGTFGPYSYQGNNVQNITVDVEPNCNHFYTVVLSDVVGGPITTQELEVCCNPCELTSFVAEANVLECNETEIPVEFDFNGINFGLEGYTITVGNDVYNFELNDPKVILLQATCEGPLELTLTDNIDPNCTLTTTIPALCCPCQFNDVSVSTSNCNNNSFDVFVSMDVEGTCQLYGFVLIVVNTVYDMQWNGNSYVVYDVVAPNDSLITYIICSNGNSNECYTIEGVNPCFIPDPVLPCALTSFQIIEDSVLCNSEAMILPFTFSGNSSFGIDGYTVSSDNLFFQNYSLNSDQNVEFAALCDGPKVFVIKDNLDPTCMLMDTISNSCCPCVLDTMIVTTSPCEDNLFSIHAFISIESGSCFFAQWTATIGDSTYALSYDNQVWTLDNFSTPDSVFVVIICNNLGDCYTFEVASPCYEPDTSLPCELFSFEVNPDPNTCSGSLITSTFTFSGNNFGINGYTIHDGFNLHTYNAGDPQVIVTHGICELSSFTIRDINDELCSLFDTTSLTCCPCSVDSISTMATCATNSSIDISIDLIDVSGYCELGGWSLIVDDSTHVLFWNVDTGNFEAFGVPVSDSMLILQICNELGPIVCFTDTIANPCFDNNSNNMRCVINQMDVSYTNQNSLKARLDLYNNQQCGVNYNVWANDFFMGEITSFEDVIYVPLDGQNEASFKFKVCNVTGEVFCIEKTADNPFFVSNADEILSEVELKYVGNNIWNLVSKNENDIELKLTDILGRTLYHRKSNTAEYINLDNYNTGLYYLEISNYNQQRKIYKLFVE